MVGCLSGGTTKRTSSIKAAKNLKASSTELNSRNQSLLGIYSAEIETAADKIILESSSTAVQREALAWKAEAIPVLQASLLNPDPVAAVLDTWVFIFQMRDYLSRSPLKEEDGEANSVVTATLTEMNAQMEQLIRTAAPAASIEDLRHRAETWATTHPIRAGLAGRQSVDPEIVRRVGESDLRMGAALRSVDERLGDLSARLDAYNMYLPKQARWQAELLLGDIARNPQIDAATRNAAKLSDAMAKTSNNLDRLPEFMNQARQAVTGDIDGQRLAAQGFVHDERVDTLDALEDERVAAVAALDHERVAATEDFRGERKQIFDDLRNHEILVMQDFDGSVEKAMQEFDAKNHRLIDHLFLRAIELVLLTVALCSLAAWVLLGHFVSRFRGVTQGLERERVGEKGEQRRFGT